MMCLVLNREQTRKMANTPLKVIRVHRFWYSQKRICKFISEQPVGTISMLQIYNWVKFLLSTGVPLFNVLVRGES